MRFPIGGKVRELRHDPVRFRDRQYSLDGRRYIRKCWICESLYHIYPAHITPEDLSGVFFTEVHNMNSNASSTKRIITTAMLSAIAYVVMVAIHLNIVPAAPFLTYDPKDVIIAIGGFIYGPAEVLIISLIVSFLEMITVSDTGIIGFVMQVIATMSYAGVAAIIYKRLHTKRGALISLCIATISMAIIMVLWNLLLSPLYLGTDRATVVAMLAPAIIPFNVLKGVINSAVVMLIYKPTVRALRKTGFVT